MKKDPWEGNCFLNFFNNNASSGNVDKTIFKSKSTSPYKLMIQKRACNPCLSLPHNLL